MTLTRRRPAPSALAQGVIADAGFGLPMFTNMNTVSAVLQIGHYVQVDNKAYQLKAVLPKFNSLTELQFDNYLVARALCEYAKKGGDGLAELGAVFNEAAFVAAEALLDAFKTEARAVAAKAQAA